MSSSTRRKSLNPSRLLSEDSTPITYVIVYFKEEEQFSCLASYSTLLGDLRDTDLTKLEKKTILKLKNGIQGHVMGTAHTLDEAKALQKKLDKRIDDRQKTGALANRSLGALDSTLNNSTLEKNQIDDNAVDNDSDNGILTRGYTLASMTIGSESESSSSEDDQPTESNELSATRIEHDDQKSSIIQELQKLNRTNKELLMAVKRQQTTQKKIVQELRKLRLGLGKGHAASSSSVTTEISNVEPVLFQDIDLVRIGPNNLSPSEYGILIARKLWNDDELKQGLLCPRKQTKTSRPALSPVRSNMVIQACRLRFNDEVAIVAARDAINQLGNDLRRGIRSRKDDFQIPSIG